ncbi:DUF5058 family protein [Virgibacillus alimentarius]|uniref:DUF5058 family protein n=1 Tax=Virgibacillus alimentarius TaxID=698769 RepID=UPI0004933E30|nr:DUF5058 family protein [Virgibacillus alimentarius]
MENVMKLANSPIVWMIAAAVIFVVIFQGIKFIQLAVNASGDVGMSKKEVRSALKTGAIAAIGPSFAIVIVAISLIAFLGDPLTLMRVGIIGSAPAESIGATMGANAYGVDLGGAGYNAQAFTAVAWTLCLGGLGWLVFTALSTKSMSKIEKKIVGKSAKSKQIMTIITTAAMTGAFGNLASAEMIKGMAYVVVAIVAALTMVFLTKLADKLKMDWLREWSLGLSIFVSLCIGYFLV